MINPGKRSYSISKAGFIRTAIKGYSGYFTIVKEFIQNSDDALVSGYSEEDKYMEIKFLPEKIIIKNGSTFSEEDFISITNIAIGEKRNNEDNTGSLGIGFVSVYQITDKPCLYSSGFKMELDPTKEEVSLKENSLVKNHTEFHLPLRFEKTDFGKNIEAGTVTDEKMSDFKKSLLRKLPQTLLFLRSLNRISVYDGNNLYLEIKREIIPVNDECSKIIIRVQNKLRVYSEEWVLFYREFDKNGFEVKKKPFVGLAVNLSSSVEGILYNFLPTSLKTGFSFHINGDFYPSFERKSINMDSSDEALWNSKLIDEIGKLFIDKIENLKKFLKKPEDFYRYLPLKPGGSYLSKIKKALINKSGSLYLILSDMGQWKRPDEIYRGDREITSILKGQVTFADRNVEEKYRSFFDEVGVKKYGPSNLLKFICKNVKPLTLLENGPDFINTKDKLFNILKYLDKNLSSLFYSKKVPLFLDNKGGLRVNDELYVWERYNEKKLLNVFKDYFDFIDEEMRDSFPLLLKHFKVPLFGLDEMLYLLTKVCEEDRNLKDCHPVINSEDKLRMIYDFIRKRYKTDNKLYINGLSMFLTQKGKLSSPAVKKSGLFLPCNNMSNDLLDDNIISETVLTSEIKYFFRDCLGIKELNFKNYLKDYVVKNYMSSSLSDGNRKNIFRNIVLKYNSLNDSFKREEIIGILKNTPLIKCNDDIYRKASSVYLPSSFLDKILSCGYEVPDEDLYDMKGDYKKSFWYQFFVNMGIKTEPAGKDIVNTIRKLTDKNDENMVKNLKEIYNYLNDNWKNFTDTSSFRELKNIKWLPDDRPEQKLHKPSELYPLRVKELVESQGNFLKFTPEPRSEFRTFLGIPGDVSTEDLVNHILWLSDNKKAIKNNIYAKLYQRRNELETGLLRNKPVIWLRKKLWHPRKVFTENCYEDFGEYRAYLKGSGIENYSDLFINLGVRDNGDKAEDYIELIKEISCDFEEREGKVLSKEHRRLLNNAYEKLSSMDFSEKLLKDLKGRRVVINDQRGLSEAKDLFIADKYSLLNKFAGYKDEIRTALFNSKETINFLKKLGVKELSKAIKRKLIENRGYYSDNKLTERLSFLEVPFIRIKRTIERNMPGLRVPLNLLKKLKVFRSGKIMVSYGLPSLNISGPLHEEGSFYDSKSKIIYINGNGNSLIHLKREMDRVMFPGLDLPNIIPQELFSVSPDKISAIMDDMDYISIVENEEKFEVPSIPEEKEETNEKFPTFEEKKSIASEKSKDVTSPLPEFKRPAALSSPKKRTDYPSLVRDLNLEKWEVEGSEVKKDISFEKVSSKEEEEKRPKAVKFVVNFINRTEGFLVLDSKGEIFFPEDKKTVNLTTDKGNSFSLYINREEKIIYNREMLTAFFVSQDIPAGGIVYIEHLNSYDNYRIYYRRVPSIYKDVKLANAEEDGSVSYDYIDMEVECETKEEVFIAEKRHEDRKALLIEGEDKKSVFETIIKVFNNSGRKILHENYIFSKVYDIRMVSNSSVQGELQKRPCFIRADKGKWKYEPERGLKIKSNSNKIKSSSGPEKILSLMEKAFYGLTQLIHSDTSSIEHLFKMLKDEIKNLLNSPISI